MAVRTVTFAPHDGDQFVEDVKQGMAAYFKSTGLSKNANTAMVMKTIILMAAFWVPYALILSNTLGGWAMIGLCLVMGVAMAGLGFSVAHDALHGAYSQNQKVNNFLGLTFDVLGANSYMWKITHNVIHHTYTNIHPIDEDLEVSPLLRLSPLGKHRWWHRFQAWYAVPAYSMSTLNWFFAKDFDLFTRKDLGPYLNKKHPRAEIAFMIGSKIFFLFWSIILPLMVLNVAWWQFALGYLLVHLVAGVILGVVFQMAHVVEQAQHPVPDEVGRMENGWMIHEMITTANFATRNRLLTWYVGGLNYQVEHHLFPKVCSVHYPALGPMVRAAAEKHGIPYNENPTLRQAIASHWAMLRRLGHGETVPEARPELQTA
jgi:linoleoyl-CoA desaturase